MPKGAPELTAARREDLQLRLKRLAMNHYDMEEISRPENLADFKTIRRGA